MYRGRLWTMRQYAGFGTAAESNARYRYLLVAGRQRPERRLRPADADGLRLGPRRWRRRSRTGGRGHRLDRGHGGAARRHPAGSRDDVDDHQLDGHHPARALRRGGAAAGRGAVRAGRHHSERHPQGVPGARHLHLPAPRRRCGSSPTSSRSASGNCRSGTRSRSAAITSARRVRRPRRRSPSRLPTRSPTCRRASTPGLDVNRLGQRLSFFFNCHNDFLEEIAKFRAARRLWAHIMRDRFGATHPRAQQLRFHTQTAGSTLTAQQPDNNIVRVAMQAMAAVLGGTQSLHCNGRDEALVAAHRGGGQDCAPHAAGHRGRDRCRQHGRSGRRGYTIEAYDRPPRGRGARDSRPHRPDRRDAGRHRGRRHPARDSGRRVRGAAGHRRGRVGRGGRQPVSGRLRLAHRRVPGGSGGRSAPGGAGSRRASEPQPSAWQASVEAVERAARDGANLVPPIIAAVEARATLGEIADAMRRVFGEYVEVHTG